MQNEKIAAVESQVLALNQNLDEILIEIDNCKQRISDCHTTLNSIHEKRKELRKYSDSLGIFKGKERKRVEVELSNLDVESDKAYNESQSLQFKLKSLQTNQIQLTDKICLLKTEKDNLIKQEEERLLKERLQKEKEEKERLQKEKEEREFKELTDAASSGDSLAMYNLANALLKQNKNNEAVSWLTKAAEKNMVYAQLDLAKYYRDGDIVKPDIEKTFYWFKKAAEQGSAEAQNIVSVYYALGDKVVKKDMAESQRWLELAYEQGLPAAIGSMAYRFFTGVEELNIKKDYQKALELFYLAANQNDPQSIGYLGIMYATGEGVEKDLNKAKEKLSEAIKNGVTYLEDMLDVVNKQLYEAERPIIKRNKMAEIMALTASFAEKVSERRDLVWKLGNLQDTLKSPLWINEQHDWRYQEMMQSCMELVRTIEDLDREMNRIQRLIEKMQYELDRI